MIEKLLNTGRVKNVSIVLGRESFSKIYFRRMRMFNISILFLKNQLLFKKNVSMQLKLNFDIIRCKAFYVRFLRSLNVTWRNCIVSQGKWTKKNYGVFL